MRQIADLHIHSKYSRATSPLMEVEALAPWARRKGITILATGDFTHPDYFKLLKTKLKEDPAGLFALKRNGDGVRFLLSAEISNIYTDRGKTRKIHTLIFAPDFRSAETLNHQLAERGNVGSDGRPILGFPVRDLAAMAFDASPRCFVVPAHIWTPWFSVFGSKSGYDSIEECFGDLAPRIDAVETGLSADAEMNWRISSLDPLSLISNSDAHSPKKLGREANILDCDPSYDSVIGAIRSRDRDRFLSTIEFYPDEGKYHYDGHRSCGISMHPRDTRQHNNRCPVCFKPLTLGVMHRVEDLADRPWNYTDDTRVPQRRAVPFQEILAEVLGAGPDTKTVETEYDRVLSQGVPELELLLDTSASDLERLVLPKVAEAILRVREGQVTLEPGYDGVYGKVSIFGAVTKKPVRKTKKANNSAGQLDLL